MLLFRYAPGLLAQGYDDPSIWPLMSDDDFEEMAELVDMLPGHRVKFAAAIYGRTNTRSDRATVVYN